MRYPASEKLEIIRLVEHSHQGVRWTLDKLGIPKTTFYRWYDRYLAFGEAAPQEKFYIRGSDTLEGEGTRIVINGKLKSGISEDRERQLRVLIS